MRRWARAERVLYHHTVGHVLLLPRGEQQPLVVSGTGAAVWDRLARPCSVEELAGELAHEYGADAATIAADVEPVLRTLEAHGAVRCQR